MWLAPLPSIPANPNTRRSNRQKLQLHPVQAQSQSTQSQAVLSYSFVPSIHWPPSLIILFPMSISFSESQFPTATPHFAMNTLKLASSTSDTSHTSYAHKSHTSSRSHHSYFRTFACFVSPSHPHSSITTIRKFRNSRTKSELNIQRVCVCCCSRCWRRGW